MDPIVFVVLAWYKNKTPNNRLKANQPTNQPGKQAGRQASQVIEASESVKQWAKLGRRALGKGS
ncbi:hypothetical protein T08_7978 [Trichinella sp. T8]|nr:hypothetical protein T08_7978 [Trichinella sp. T8]